VHRVASTLRAKNVANSGAGRRHEPRFPPAQDWRKGQIAAILPRLFDE